MVKYLVLRNGVHFSMGEARAFFNFPAKKEYAHCFFGNSMVKKSVTTFSREETGYEGLKIR